MGEILEIITESKKILKSNTDLENNQIETLKVKNTKMKMKNYRLNTTMWRLWIRIIEEYREKFGKYKIENRRRWEYYETYNPLLSSVICVYNRMRKFDFF